MQHGHGDSSHSIILDGTFQSEIRIAWILELRACMGYLRANRNLFPEQREEVESLIASMRSAIRRCLRASDQRSFLRAEAMVAAANRRIESLLNMLEH